jgi:flavin reductase (DIM6/NTAB) family NADH-FMN oxidoreductase RutF
MIDRKKLRENLGFFTTGVMIACARKRNFFATKFFNPNFLENNSFIKKFEDFWDNFFAENSLGKRISQKISVKISSQDFKIKNPDLQNFIDEKILTKIKKIFADEFFGMTINSFSSISLNPPLVAFCVDNKSTNLKFFKQNRYFIFNILSQDQQDLSTAFATPKNSNKWRVEPYFFSKFGNPIFNKTLAFIECKKHKIIKMGDHHIVVGEVIDFGKINDSQPLIYYRGKYQNLHS